MRKTQNIFEIEAKVSYVTEAITAKKIKNKTNKLGFPKIHICSPKDTIKKMISKPQT